MARTFDPNGSILPSMGPEVLWVGAAVSRDAWFMKACLSVETPHFNALAIGLGRLYYFF